MPIDDRDLALGSDPIQRLILELSRLPGIGERSATRLAFHIIRASPHQGPSLARDLAKALVAVSDQVGMCKMCQNLCSGERCRVCDSPSRQSNTICVVESVQDLRAIESISAYKGLYHVLHGALAPLDGIGPEDLKIPHLLSRLEAGVTEVILATNADVEGDATALYLTGLIKPLGIRVTRLASGIPLGGELEYIDHATLGRALAERREL
ncbi:MAG: recombination protein RecR [Deltaproteobacteria bacterium RIFOXYA12_FULL_58_15]|nr:MAG: recombination protein RecR [Deltaproteobacteria bacterium RIFOXYA12_FULL_58_15]OGR11166.1 MAG: recombination protein RecR [Deltaproteobacteria bacterium RIFOXYB12_FULL_58_9]